MTIFSVGCLAASAVVCGAGLALLLAWPRAVCACACVCVGCGAAVGLRRPLIVGATVGAAVGARHAGEDLGMPMTARESSTARGTARFFVLAPGDATLFDESIEWTIVEV